MPGKLIPFLDRGLASSLDDHAYPSGVTEADELFFNLDGRVLSITDDQWRLEVCGVHTLGTQHWVQLNVHGIVGCGLTFRTENLDAGQLLDQVSACLHHTMTVGEL